jgi:primosomal protein N' (replication factor Y)
MVTGRAGPAPAPSPPPAGWAVPAGAVGTVRSSAYVHAVIAKVEPLTPARSLRGPFDYLLAGAFEDVGVGSMLVVPFGRRRVLGVVVDVADGSDVPHDRLVEPLAALEADVPPELVRLGLWVAREYVSTPARGLALVLPPGTGTGATRPVRPRRALRAAMTPAGVAAIGGVGAASDGAPAGDGAPGGDAAPAGDVSPHQLPSPPQPSSGASLGPRQRAALAALAGGPLGAATVARRAGCDHSTLRSLERRGLVRLEHATEPARRPRVEGVGPRAGRVTLTPAQLAALRAIESRLDPPGRAGDAPRPVGGAGRQAGHAAGSAGDTSRPPGDAGGLAREARGARPLLLHGVTGSGKTEVYLRAVAAALRRRRSAIVLVPEIALTPQTAGRFVDRFGEAVAVMHSRLSRRERYDEWWRMRRGEARVCVGPRSAVFAPFDDLGLLVVDEEHDASYKQDGDPRYDARRVAERRAAGQGALLVVGSATPRPESALRYERLELPQRVDGRRLPPVELVGMARATGAIHDRTREALDEVRRRREKAVVLLNRRGWSNFLSCRGCGRAWECPNCDVTLVLHRAVGEIACHHCGHRERVPAVCDGCGSVSVARHGLGTEQLERELECLVAPLPVFRLDSDAAVAAGVAAVLRRFDAAPAGVLVGTQMVAKGHDFPEVTLGVVLDADATLRFPDFRAEERTFALVAQLAGRSGRGERGGRVIVQALDPDARALRHAARHDSAGFLSGELARRRALSYPPHGELIRVVCSSVEAGPEVAAAEAVRALVEAAEVPVLGPAPLFRRQERHRAQLVIRSPDREAAIAAVRQAVETVASDRAHGQATFAVDVDPQ